MSTPCYHCEKNADEFKPCYASALVFPGGIRDAVLDAEKDLTPCFTAYCPRCREVRLLTTEAAGFPTRSAHHVHQLVLMRRLLGASMLLP
jgi:hypothetical protein